MSIINWSGHLCTFAFPIPVNKSRKLVNSKPRPIGNCCKVATSRPVPVSCISFHYFSHSLHICGQSSIHDWVCCLRTSTSATQVPTAPLPLAARKGSSSLGGLLFRAKPKTTSRAALTFANRSPSRQSAKRRPAASPLAGNITSCHFSTSQLPILSRHY